MEFVGLSPPPIGLTPANDDTPTTILPTHQDLQQTTSPFSTPTSSSPLLALFLCSFDDQIGPTITSCYPPQALQANVYLSGAPGSHKNTSKPWNKRTDPLHQLYLNYTIPPEPPGFTADDDVAPSQKDDDIYLSIFDGLGEPEWRC